MCSVPTSQFPWTGCGDPALSYGLFKRLSHCGGDSDKPTAHHWAHTAESPCPQSQEQCFLLALGMGSSWAAVSIWHWSEEGLVATRAGTRKGMAEESHGRGQQAPACPLIARSSAQSLAGTEFAVLPAQNAFAFSGD